MPIVMPAATAFRNILPFSFTSLSLPNRDRTLAKEELCEVLAKYGICAEQAVHIEQALVLAKKRAGKDGVVLAFGSLSYLGEVIRLEENAERK